MVCGWAVWWTSHPYPQRAHNAIMVSLWRQNDVATSFRRHDNVVIASCAHCDCTFNCYRCRDIFNCSCSDMDWPQNNTPTLTIIYRNLMKHSSFDVVCHYLILWDMHTVLYGILYYFLLHHPILSDAFDLSPICVDSFLQSFDFLNGREVILKIVNSLRPRQNRRHIADDVFKSNFLDENVWIPIKISLKFVP